MRIRHVIVDRDGVLNVELATGWVADWRDWRWVPRSLAALRYLSDAGVLISVATNQSCIGRGIVSYDAVDAIHVRLRDEVAAAGARLHGVYVCPHAPDDGCECRKPKPGLVIAAIAASNILSNETILIGDARRDVDAGRAAGIATALVRTGKGRSTEQSLNDDRLPVFDDLWDASGLIVAGASNMR